MLNGLTNLNVIGGDQFVFKRALIWCMILFIFACQQVNKAGYTAISRVRLGRGSNAQKLTKKLRKKTGDQPTDGPTDGPTLL